MRWEIELYVRLYRRDTAEWSLVPWRARGLFDELLRKASLDGSIECGRMEPAAAVAVLLRAPPTDVPEIAQLLAILLADGCVVDVPAAGSRGRHLLIPNYRPAQGIPMTGAERTARWREGKQPQGQGKMSQPDESDTVTDPNRSDPNRSEPKVGGEQSSPPAPRKRQKQQELPVETSPVMAELACVGPGEPVFAVTEAMCDAWQRCFPAVNVREQVLRACQWALDNPKRRKTLGGARAFLGRWMSSEQDKNADRRSTGTGSPGDGRPNIFAS